MSMLIRLVLPTTVGCSVLLGTDYAIQKALSRSQQLVAEASQLLSRTDVIDGLSDQEIDSMIPDDCPHVLLELDMLESEFRSLEPVAAISSAVFDNITVSALNLSDQEFDARVPDDDPQVLAEFTALQDEASRTEDRISRWTFAARDYLSPAATRAYDYFMATLARAQEYASSLTAHAFSVTTTLPQVADDPKPRLRRERRITRTPIHRPVWRMSKEERIVASRNRHAAILSNLMLMYRTVKTKDPARAAELAVRIQQIGGLMKDHLSSQEH